VSVDPKYRELRDRLIADPREGWRLFMEMYTPTLVAIIEHAGVRQKDEAMDVYVRVCEHLAADDCARLRRHDPSRGTLAAWLTTVVRRAIVDWVRSKKGRRRVFASIRALPARDREIFDLYYWRGHSAGEIVQLLEPQPALSDVFEALERIELAFTDRQRAEMMSMAARSRAPLSLEEERIDPADSALDPEQELRVRQTHDALAAALAELPAEDSLIVSMRYVDGLSQSQVERALHIGAVSSERMKRILARLRELLESRGLGLEAVAAR
jgi:DNA-directed RNA polymerase specialized sigma24 family protein